MQRDRVPVWTLNILKFQLALVYFYAGLAKLNTYWLLEAMPLKIWLPAHSGMPLIGSFLEEAWVAYAFSWGGALFDLAIPFLLLLPSTRGAAYVLVVIFHLLTRLLFPIGMFPYIMIASALIFFSTGLHDRAWQKIVKMIGRKTENSSAQKADWTMPQHFKRSAAFLLSFFLVLQLLVPWRYLCYPGNLFWTEEGYRFSWRVMLMEKAGYATFTVTDPQTGNSAEVDASELLPPHQERMMSTQPDMILQFAHHLEDEYRTQGLQDVEVRAKVYVTLNGRRSQLLIDPDRDLTTEKYNLKRRDWILPFQDDL
jgi:hypothetical protein